MSVKRKNNVKRKNLFSLLCSCLPSKDIDHLNDQKYGLVDDRDRYEYVVEKLAIKKVPLSIFGTKTDYDKIINEKPVKCVRNKTEEVLPGKNVDYHSYYVQMRHKNRSNSPTRIETTTTSSSSSDTSSPCQPMQQNAGNKEMISHILNKYSSLYTLDDKEAIPKDPSTLKTYSHSPTCPTMMMPKMEVPRVPIRHIQQSCVHQQHSVNC